MTVASTTQFLLALRSVLHVVAQVGILVVIISSIAGANLAA
jgi:hypothetical protein